MSHPARTVERPSFLTSVNIYIDSILPEIVGKLLNEKDHSRHLPALLSQ